MSMSMTMQIEIGEWPDCARF